MDHLRPQNDHFSTTFCPKIDPVFEGPGNDSFAEK